MKGKTFGAVDLSAWAGYLRCPYCNAAPGKPCMTRQTAEYLAKPHPGRERVEVPA